MLRPPPGATAPTTSARLEVRGLTVGYRRRLAVDAVDLTAEPGERLGIIGPNGAGKTSLLRAIVGTTHARAGEVYIGGTPARDVRRRVGYLPQRAEVDWEHPAEVRDVVTMGRYPHRGPIGRLREDDRAAIADALERLELTSLARRRVAELSGGQRQRTALARVLAQQAPVLVLDEPYAGLDATTTTVIEDTLQESAAAGTTVVVVDHDLGRLKERYDRLVALDRTVVAHGSVEEVLTRQVLATTYGLADVLADLDDRAGGPGPRDHDRHAGRTTGDRTARVEHGVPAAGRAAGDLRVLPRRPGRRHRRRRDVRGAVVPPGGPRPGTARRRDQPRGAPRRGRRLPGGW